MKYHPDVAKEDPTAGERFKEITEAYSIIKKHYQKVEELTRMPGEDPDFVSQRPPPPTEDPSTYRPPNEPKEYINFQPLKVKLPENDRLGLNYKPLFNDQDSVHPKAGTITIGFCCVALTSFISMLFLNLEDRDYRVNELILKRLERPYSARDWDRKEMFPALQVFKNDPEYQQYVKTQEMSQMKAKFRSFFENGNVVERFSIAQEDKKLDN